jgi:hypothetical protein
MSKNYRFRYKVERWEKPPQGVGERVRPGLRVSQDDHGYADGLFIASLVEQENGTTSIALLSSEGNPEGKPSKELLQLIRDQIDHYLEKHT